MKQETIKHLTQLEILIEKLNNNYKPRIPQKAKEQNNVLESEKKLLNPRKNIVLFKKGTFLYKRNFFKTKE